MPLPMPGDGEGGDGKGAETALVDDALTWTFLPPRLTDCCVDEFVGNHGIVSAGSAAVVMHSFHLW